MSSDLVVYCIDVQIRTGLNAAQLLTDCGVLSKREPAYI